MTDASERLGQLLLQGWTMTEMLCPDAARCHGTPLMRPRNADHMLCVSCDRWFVRTPDGSVALENPEAKAEEKEAPKPQEEEKKECREKKDLPVPAAPAPAPVSDAGAESDDADASAAARCAMARLVAVIEAQSAGLRPDADSAAVTAACRALEAAAAAYEALRPLARRA